MIKAISEIPQSGNEKRKSIREMIRKDVQEAIDKGISKFEFVGDDYNYKYLANYAREETRRIAGGMYREFTMKYREEYKRRFPKASFPMFYERDCKRMNPFKIHSIKGETKDKPRVFCEIAATGTEYENKLLEYFEAIMPRRQKEGEEYEKRLKRMGIRVDEDTESFSLEEVENYDE